MRSKLLPRFIQLSSYRTLWNRECGAFKLQVKYSQNGTANRAFISFYYFTQFKLRWRFGTSKIDKKLQVVFYCSPISYCLFFVGPCDYMLRSRCCGAFSYFVVFVITKTRLFKYHLKKTENFQIKKKIRYFSYFCSKHRLWVLVRTAPREAVLTSIHNLCFWAEIKKNDVYPCKPQIYCIKVGFKGIKII